MARISLAGMVLWEGLGFNTMLMLAGLQRIPRDLYEAAAVDGASPLEAERVITLPLMVPIMLFVSITTTFGTFNLFTEPNLLTVGGPGTATLTPGLLLYQMAFSYGRLGPATALGLVIGGVAAIFGLAQLRLSRVRT